MSLLLPGGAGLSAAYELLVYPYLLLRSTSILGSIKQAVYWSPGRTGAQHTGGFSLFFSLTLLHGKSASLQFLGT